MKKQVVRMFSIVIAVLVVSMSLPLGAFAASAPQTNGVLYVDSAIGVDYYYGTPMYYAFYPEETGVYRISSSGDMDTFATVLDRDMAMLKSDDDSGENGNFALDIKLEKNRLYYVKVGSYGSGYFNVSVTMPEAATSLEIHNKLGERLDSVYGHTGEILRCFVSFLPENSIGAEVVWSVGNTDIAEVDVYGNVTFKAQGQTTLTATAGVLSATVPVISASAIELVAGVENTIELDENGDHLCIYYTAAEVGDYIFRYSELQGLKVSVFDEKGTELFANEDISGGFNYGVNVENEVLVIRVDYSECAAETFSIKGERVIYADSVDIYTEINGQKSYSNYYYVYVGETLKLNYDIFPENGVLRGDVTFYSTNPDSVSVTEDGLVTVNSLENVAVYVSGDGVYDQIEIYPQSKNEIEVGVTTSYSLDEYNGGKFIGTLTVPEGSQNYKITFGAPNDITFKILDENGNVVLERTGTEGFVKQGLGGPYTYQVIVTTEEILSPVYFHLTVKEYVPLDNISIVDVNGDDISEYSGKVGEIFTVYGKASPEESAAGFKWESDDPQIATVDEYGNVALVSPGYTNIRVYALEEDGSVIEGWSDSLYIFADKIEDFEFGYSYYITIEDYTTKLRTTASHTGFFYVYTYGNDTAINLEVIKTSDGSFVTVRPKYISETEREIAFYLEAGEQYIIRFYGPYGNSYNLQTGEYDIPESINIVDSLNVTKTDHSGYVGDSINLNIQYDKYNCFGESLTWESSDESVATVTSEGYVSFLKVGTATITVTTETGLTAELALNVIDAKAIALDTPLTETLSFDGTEGVRFKFTPQVTAVYEINAVNAVGGDVSLDFTFTDSSYNAISNSYAYSSLSAKLEAGKTYIIKVRECNMGGTYHFTLTNKTIALNAPVSLSIAEGMLNDIIYYFIPETTGYYCLSAAGYTNNWGRGINIYDSNENIVSESQTTDTDSLAYAALTAGEVYKIIIYKYYSFAEAVTLVASKAIGIAEMQIETMPTNSTIVAGSDDYSLNGLVLKVIKEDDSVCYWDYSNSPDNLCGFSYSITLSPAVDGVRLLRIKAGGGFCDIPYTVKEMEKLSLNNPVRVNLGYEYASTSYEFTPEKTGWYVFKTFNHTADYSDRNMSLYLDSWIADGICTVSEGELYAYLTKDEAYRLKVYKNSYPEESFTLSVSEGVGIESLTIKQYPTNMTVYEGNTGNPDFTGLILTVTTSDGQTEDWTYTKESNRMLGYLYQKSWSEYEDRVEYNLWAGGKNITLNYNIVEYPLKNIEVVTAGITIFENTNGWFISEDTYYYNVPTDRIRLKFNYNDGSFKFASVYDMVDGYHIGCYDSQNEKPWTAGGDNYFTVTFKDIQIQVPVNIVENDFESMRVIDDGDLTATEGDAHFEQVSDDGGVWFYDIDYSKVKIELSFKDGSTVIASVDDVVKGVGIYPRQFENPIEAGKDNFVTVYYGDATVDLPVTYIENDIESISLSKKPDSYIYGDLKYGGFDGEDYFLEPEFSDGYELTVKYKDGKEVVLSDADFKNGSFVGDYPVMGCYNYPADLETNKLYLAWSGKTIEFDVEFADSDVESIEVLEAPTVPESNEYYPDMAGLKLKINYKNSESKTVTVTEASLTYKGMWSVIYEAEVDGETFVIEDWNDGYRVGHRGAFAYFNVENKNSFYIEDLQLIDFDKASETFTVSFVYCTDNGKENRILQIDASNAEKTTYIDSVSYSGFVKSEKGIFTYWLDCYTNKASGISGCSFSLFGCDSYGDLTDSAGDINGDFKIDIRDLVRLKKLIAEKDVELFSSADFDGDGNQAASDLAYLRKCILGEALLSVVYGDADGNGYIDHSDALAIATYLAGSDERLSSRADVNRDGVIDKKDLDIINDILG